MTLDELGWGPAFAEAFEPHAREGRLPARVAAEHKHAYTLYSAEGELTGSLPGRTVRRAASRLELPTTGDWVAVERHPQDPARGVIRALLPRQSQFLRRAAGREVEVQVVAANVDTVFLMTGLDQDFSIRRLERYLTAAWDSGATPVVVLNKADLTGDLEAYAAQVGAVAPAVPIHGVSAKTGAGVEALRVYLGPGRTVALLGSSGVGKSTLINRLVGAELLETREVSQRDSRGRHTTTRRELIPMPGGGLLVDTPGMREFQPWEGAAVLDTSFEDVRALAEGCRFRDCAHEREPGCAVKLAVADGRLDPGRLESYQRLQRELRHQLDEQDIRARLETKRRWKIIQKSRKDLPPKR